MGTFVVDEACWCDGAYRVSEDGCVVGNEGLKIAWGWSGPSTARIEVLGYHLVNKTRVIVELTAHLGICILACELGFLAAFDDELEALVELVLDLFAVFEILLGVLLEELDLLVAVCSRLAIVHSD
jgi:hypothetical protein